MPDRELLLLLLQELEAELRVLGLWESVSPPSQAFASELPFYFDTMTFTQWMQWVFIARFRAIVEGRHPLPARCAVAHMAEEALKEMDLQTGPIIAILQQIDALFEKPLH